MWYDGDEGEDDDLRKVLVRVGARTRGDDGWCCCVCCWGVD